MSTRPITDELVAEVIGELRQRYDMDADDVRALGSRLASLDRRAENVTFAEQFVAEHKATFDRLAE